MKAVCWQGAKDVRLEDVPEPKVLNPRDAVVRITSTAICGSDLHLYNGFFPQMHKGDVIGHECMGEVVAVGSGLKDVKEGDRVVVPCIQSCGSCFFCRRALFSCCDNSNPNAVESEKLFGYPMAGVLGYSHLTGGYAGGQAELIRVPYSDFGLIRVPKGVPDEKVLFLSDILPTAWMAAENCQVEPGDAVAVWGCGPVGQLAIRCLFTMGAERVFAIDSVPERLEMAARSGAETINHKDFDVYDTLYDLTAGRGPDACLDACGMEAHAASPPAGIIDRVKQSVGLENDRPFILREMIRCVRKGGTISLIGVYSGMVDHIPLGIAFNKGVTFKMGQVHIHRYRDLLLDAILQGKLDPSAIITHTLPLDDAPAAYKMFNDKTDGCVKVVLKPGAQRTNGHKVTAGRM